ncbi:hypothetical protein [Pantanalinema sp. GBBB05]|uniref:hypothetical protein n=1 Tax=Pantanalinema sp. GBBB05 TaxID=2604139 RepID=UPI001E004F13|nr:hypothetical protein [Pantanalinema sp. GBBB05]
MEILEIVDRIESGTLTCDAIASLIAERDSHRSRQAALEVIMVHSLTQKGLTPEEISDKVNEMVKLAMQTEDYKHRVAELQNLSYQEVAA